MYKYFCDVMYKQKESYVIIFITYTFDQLDLHVLECPWLIEYLFITFYYITCKDQTLWAPDCLKPFRESMEEVEMENI